ncbi:DNA polymerase subunit gamma-1 [Geodia barretti]|uniref:DNA polymerase subunit gamma-1 n=1 Tax=Geodia barretti TaxID=519541 RepID=A0AA35QYW7_GEOBA|nr:DNA polymerase subunit gamma-1 [Geodia barretti]
MQVLPKRRSAAIFQPMQTTRARPWIAKIAGAFLSASTSSQSRQTAAETDSSSRRTSELGIQMISKSLHEQIFGSEPRVSEEAVKKSKRHLMSHGINVDAGGTKPLRDVDVELPPLTGCNVNDHFVNIAKQQIEPYLSLAQELAKTNLPQMPKKWQFSTGWTKYNGNKATAVPYPDETALVLDVEVCVRDSERPVLATAVSGSHWYSWVSKRLASHEDYSVEVQEDGTTARSLIPLEPEADECEMVGEEKSQWKQRVVVGHNVGYDRARIKEQYLLKGPKTKFLDTLSLHVCIAGQTAAQKLVWKKHNGNSQVASGQGSEGWLSVSSPNGLADVHWLHVGSHNGTSRIDKEKRNVFVKGRIQDVRKQFQSLMRYCANDVVSTHEVLGVLLPQFLQRCPHPVTLAGMLEMGGAYMPVDASWNKYIADCEYVYEEMGGEIKAKLMALADDACTYMHGKRYLESPWLCNLDWSTKKFRGKSKKSDMKKLLDQLERYYELRDEEFRLGGAEREDGEGRELEEGEGKEEGGSVGKSDFFISGDGPAKRAVHMPGYPEWYRSLCMRRSDEQWCPGAVLVSAQTRVAPYLLRMKWKGFPLHYHNSLGWGYIVPQNIRPGEVLEWDEEDNVGVQIAGNSDKNLSHSPLDDGEGEGALFGIEAEVNVFAKSKRQVHHSEKEEEKEAEGEGEGEGGTKRRENIETPFGTTDDVVHLRNGKTYYFFKLPHKDGSELNVGNPLAKSFLHQMETGTLTSAAGRLGQRILTLNSAISFWRSARQRILEQFVVWEEKDNSSENSDSVARGVILPQLVVAGTVTRRAVEPTWLTASNAKETRVGSELKVMVRAPDGYHFVGADVDSQELWIAAVLGDTRFAGMHGCTAVGWMTLQGSKSEGTDVHSNTASTIGISRDQAKVLNYGRIYGAGRPFIELLLKQFNPSLTGTEVADKSRTLLEATKGRRHYKLTEEGTEMVEHCGVRVGEERLVPVDAVRGMRWVSRYTTGRVWRGGR